MRTFVIAGLLLSTASIAAATADPERGKQLHLKCLSCHSTLAYEPPRRKIESLTALKREVDRWNRSYNPKFSRAEIDDIVAYLNRDFYRFPK